MTKTIVSQIEKVLISHYHVSPSYLVGQVSVLLDKAEEDCENLIIALLLNSLPAAHEAVPAAKELMKVAR